MRKAFRSSLLVVLVTLLAVVVAKRIPGGFVPDEDNGYFFANIVLPDASSLERTDAVSKKVEEIIGKTPGVEYVTTITGYSLVSGAYASNTAFLFVSLKPWEERKAESEHAFALIRTLNQQLAREGKLPEAAAAYIWGDRTLRTIHCKTCGCVTHWEPLPPTPGARHGVNLGNFDPELIASVRIRRFDGANTWIFIDE